LPRRRGDRTTSSTAKLEADTASTADNAVGVLGQVTSTSPGNFSAAVRGINNGTGSNGVGVIGSQAGSGWGVWGQSVGGIGVKGQSAGEHLQRQRDHRRWRSRDRAAA
jgi:hypothetical protein